MRAVRILSDKLVLNHAEIVELVIWQVPSPVPPSEHDFKYRLVYVRDGKRVVGYDDERGKGDHKHVMGEESTYAFTTIAQLLDDFEADVLAIRGEPI